MASSFRPSSFIVPAILVGMGTMTIASAQSSSPFAKKTKQQAWETVPQTAPNVAVPNPRAPRAAAPVARPIQPNAGQTYKPQSPSQQQASPNWQSYQNTAQQAAPAEPGVYYPGRRNGGAAAAQSQNLQSYESSPQRSLQHNGGQNYGSPSYAARQPQVQYHDAAGNVHRQPNSAQWGQQAPGHYAQTPQYPNSAQAQPPFQSQPAKQSWTDKLGFGRLQTIFRGSATVGAAAVENRNGVSGWDAEFIGDADAEVEINAITQGGLEYGVVLGARAQYDRFRRGFGQRLPDCLPDQIGCSSVDINGTPTGLRGHTSQFYTAGTDDARPEEAQLETAYLFLRSAYGDLTIGRDDGSAYLFSLGAPSLLKVGASNSPVDYTGFDSVKTVNDASGFAEKVTYTTPRLLGDTVGVGVQLGVSYAPNAEACGVDYCVRSNNDQGSGTIAAELRNIVEVGVALDRKFDNGLKVEVTGNYARADERSGFAGLDDFESYNGGVELTYNDWTLGGSYLNSNNGLLNGDYEAYDVGLTWKPSRLGFTLGYGHATDDNVNLSSDQGIFGVTYDFDTITIGGGVQYIDRTTSAFDGTSVTRQSEDATALFIEAGFKF